MGPSSVKEFWLQFLQLYKSRRCLWDADSVEYLNRVKRKEAYDELVNFAKTINAKADNGFVKSRINNVRTAYRKEVKKVLKAKENGSDYKPKLFYYDLLNSFLNQNNASEFDFKQTYSDNTSEEEDPFASLEPTEDNETMNNSKQVADEANSNDAQSNNDEDSHIKNEQNHGEKVEGNKSQSLLGSDNELSKEFVSIEQFPNNSTSKTTYNSRRKRPLKRVSKSNMDEYEQLEENDSETELARKRQRLVDDEYAILGRRIATHFRNMKPQQRLLAEKIISDVCIFARMDQLTLRSGLTIELPQNFNNFIQQPQSKLNNCEEVIVDDEIDLAPEAYIQAL